MQKKPGATNLQGRRGSRRSHRGRVYSLPLYKNASIFVPAAVAHDPRKRDNPLTRMPDESDSLMSALQRKDAQLFADVGARLAEAKDKGVQTGYALLQVIVAADPSRAELAVNALRFSGLALLDEVYIGLLRAAKQLYPPSVLQRLRSVELLRERERKERAAAEVRLLRSLVMAILRKEESGGMEFVRNLMLMMRGTRFADSLAKWGPNQ